MLVDYSRLPVPRRFGMVDFLAEPILEPPRPGSHYMRAANALLSVVIMRDQLSLKEAVRVQRHLAKQQDKSARAMDGAAVAIPDVMATVDEYHPDAISYALAEPMNARKALQDGYLVLPHNPATEPEKQIHALSMARSGCWARTVAGAIASIELEDLPEMHTASDPLVVM